MPVPFSARIALVSLPSPWQDEAMNPPLGLTYLAASLIHAGWLNLTAFDGVLIPQRYFDACGTHLGLHSWAELLPDADVYLISCVTPQFRFLREAITEIRKRACTSLIIVGGPHATVCPGDCVEVGADVVIRGEADDLILRVFCNPKQRGWPSGFVKELDELPSPARHLWPMSKYHRTIHGQPAAHIVTLRGCPFDCAFCATEAIPRKVRFRSVENVMLEVDHLQKTFGTKGLVIYDDQFLLSPDRVLRFCEEFGGRGIHWRCWSRADLVRPLVLLRMRESGLTSITIGIESGDDFVLGRAGKRTTAWRNWDALLMCKEAGVPVRCSLIYGLPGETPDSLRHTVEMIRSCQPDEWELSIFSPVPGSDIWNRPGAYGVSFDKAWLKGQDYFPINRYGESGIGTLWIDLDTMRRDELQARLPEFIGELEHVCPRKKIQDTIRRIDPLKVVETV